MACELILALDLPDRAQTLALLRPMRGSLRWVKIGLQMFTAYGPDWVRTVADEGFNVFLDLKLHDIPNTVAHAVESLSVLPIGMLTLHASGGRAMLTAAKTAQAQNKPGLLLLGVTVLTSLDAAGLAATGVNSPPAVQVNRLATLAVESGLSGLVCSPQEVTALRRALPPLIQLVTPGIRPAETAGTDDQSRVMTPRQAAQTGSNFIVVGRPILQAPDPFAAVRTILAEIGQP